VCAQRRWWTDRADTQVRPYRSPPSQRAYYTTLFQVMCHSEELCDEATVLDVKTLYEQQLSAL
jgi:hypothetical protein